MTPVAEVESVHYVWPYSESKLLAALADGPVAGTVAASSSVFRYYTSGVINTRKCGYWLNHAITIVGYGTYDRGNYYIVRNSWGDSWGDAGYVKIGASGERRIGYCGI